MEAFSIFIQHWMKEENKVKEKLSKERSRQKATKACQQIVHNRSKLYEVRKATDLLQEMEAELYDQENDFEEELGLGEELEEFISIVEFMIDHYLCHVPNRIYGLCEKCESGIVHFEINLGYDQLSAICKNCDTCHLFINNINLDLVYFVDHLH